MVFRNKFSHFLRQTQLCLFVLYFTLFAWLQWWAGVIPRLIRGSERRAELHHAHLNLGAPLFVFLCLFLLIWLLRPGRSITDRLKHAFRDLSATAVSLFLCGSLLAMLFGLSQGWSKQEEAAVFGVIKLPHFFQMSWQTSGYMHSALSNISVFLFSGIVFVYLYKKLRKYLEPGYAVAALLLLHLLIALPKPPSLHPIAAIGAYMLTPFIYLSALALYTWANDKKLVYWPALLVFILYFLYLPYFAFKVLPPWHQKSQQVVLVAPTENLSAARAKNEIFPDAESLAAAEVTTAWCRQCHSVNHGDAHLLGPNLTDIFNKQVASKADYGRYSTALISKGQAGTYWSREELAKFLTDGQAFAPGNLMNQQTDLSDEKELNKALDYLEYISAN